MRIASEKMPKFRRRPGKPVDPEVLAELAVDLEGSVDFHPHAASDGKVYRTYAEAASLARRVLAALESNGHGGEFGLRSRIWDTAGSTDRKAPGKWVFGLTYRSRPRPTRSK